MLPRLSSLGSSQPARDLLPACGATAPFKSAPEPDELLLPCTSVFSMKGRCLFGTSDLMFEPAPVDGVGRDGRRSVGSEFSGGPGGDNGPRPPRAASPSAADWDLSLACFLESPFPKNIESEQAELQNCILILLLTRSRF